MGGGFICSRDGKNCIIRQRENFVGNSNESQVTDLSQSPPFFTMIKFISDMPPTGARPQPVENASNFDLSSSVIACVISQNHLICVISVNLIYYQTGKIINLKIQDTFKTWLLIQIFILVYSV